MGNFLTTDTIDYVLKARDFKPDVRKSTPDGWFFNTWMLTSFQPDQYVSYRAALIRCITGGSNTEDGYSFPLPRRSGLFRVIGQGGAAAYNVLTLSLIFGM